MITTHHSIDRTMERCNLKSQQAAEKRITLAIQRGKYPDQCTSWERSYLSKEAHDNCTAIAYNGFCFIINESGQCVTMHPLPKWFGKKKHFDGKERIRDFKKNYKNNPI